MSDDSLQSLREALRFSPDNIPLRQHLAEMLLGRGRPQDAEKEYREALQLAPNNSDLKIGLARAFYQQSKNSEALVIVEDLIKSPQTPAPAYLLHARLLLQAGDVQRAVHQYHQALDTDPDAADLDLAAQLGINAGESSDVVEGRVRSVWNEPEEFAERDIETPSISFEDVGGMDALKEEIRMKIMLPLTNPDLFKAYGKAAGGGILMYGPPGCGKTYLARATAGEVHAGFLAIGINDILEMWIGQSERNLHEIFEQARRNKPCVLFFDEVDALGASRSDMRQSSGRHLINQFLSELDGVNTTNDGVLILAATNAPWHLDSAFRRPGRFDRILFVPPPDRAARALILQLHCREKPIQNIDYQHIAKKTEHFSGADLKSIVDLAVESKLREAMKSGKVQPLTTRDLMAAVSSVKPSTREWFSAARNHALYANQAGLYDDILKYLKI